MNKATFVRFAQSIYSLPTNLGQFVIRPFRYLGIFGTESAPRYYLEGDEVPHDVLLFFPPKNMLGVKCYFLTEVAVYFDPKTGHQTVKSIDPCEVIVSVKSANQIAHASGAPTIWDGQGGGGDKDRRTDSMELSL